MARQSVNSEVNNFEVGMITESSPSNSVPGSFRLVQNWDYTNERSIKKRKGLEFVNESYTDTNLNLSYPFDISGETFTWYIEAVDKTFVCVRLGAGLSIFDFEVSTTAPVSQVTVASPFRYVIFDDVLVFAAGNGAVNYIFYKPNAPTEFAVNSVTTDVIIRDLFGEPQTDVTERPTAANWAALDDGHKYNLENAGWTETEATAFEVQASAWPALSDIPWSFKDPATGARDYTLYDDIVNNGRAPFGRFKIGISNREGYRESESSLGTGDATTDESIVEFKDLTLFAGRLFYLCQDNTADPDTDLSDTAPRFTGMLLFSKQTENPFELAECYSNNDPTDEFNNQVEETAGGFIKIDGMRRPQRLEPYRDGLLAFAENGIWYLKNGQQTIFSPNNYQVQKVSDIGITSNSAAVSTDTTVFFMSPTGIYAIVTDNYGNLIVQNISNQTVKSVVNAVYGIEDDKFSIFYPTKVAPGGIIAPVGFNVADLSQKNIKARYDRENNQIIWLLNDYSYYENYTGLNGIGLGDVLGIHYNTHLLFDLESQTFTVKDYQSRVGVFDSTKDDNRPLYNPAAGLQLDGYIIDTFDLRTITPSSSTSSETTDFKKYFATLGSNGTDYLFNFCTETSTKFADYSDGDGEDVPIRSILISNEIIAGDTQRRKGGAYLTLSMKGTDPVQDPDDSSNYLIGSSCKIFYGWDSPKKFNERYPIEGLAPSLFKVNGPYEGYRERGFFLSDPGSPTTLSEDYSRPDIVYTKNKIVGRGRSLQIRLEATDINKDAHIYSMGFQLQANTKV